MKKTLFIGALLCTITPFVNAQKLFSSYDEAARFLVKRVEYSGPEGKDIFRPFIPGTVLVSMKIKDGKAESWNVIHASDTSLSAGIKKACDESMKLWSFITKETTLIIPFYFDNAEDISMDKQRIPKDSSPVLQIIPSRNQELVVMNTIPTTIQVAIQKIGGSAAQR